MVERGNKWVLSYCHGNIRELRALGVHARGQGEKRPGSLRLSQGMGCFQGAGLLTLLLVMVAGCWAGMRGARRLVSRSQREPKWVTHL